MFQIEDGCGVRSETPSLDAKRRKVAGRPSIDLKRKQGNVKEEEEHDKETSCMPNILEIQTAIASVAASCGRPPRRVSTKLKWDHEAVRELDEVTAERSMTTDVYTRILLCLLYTSDAADE